ncbi:MAG: DNA topoisomerase [Dehalococcoidia bacterium]
MYLATDPDREERGDLAGTWWRRSNTEPSAASGRVPEITRDAVPDAFAHPRELDNRLVDAQQARQVVDRLVGYKISPLLWKKVRRGLSAGRGLEVWRSA